MTLAEFCSDADSRATASKTGCRWFPCNKGGEYRKWYGNRPYVVDWADDGNEMKSAGLTATTFRNSGYYFRQGITWSSISSAKYHARWSPAGAIGERKGAMAFSDDPDTALKVLGAINSSSVHSILAVLAPTLDFSEGPIGRCPIPSRVTSDGEISRTVKDLIEISIMDYDSFETSWDFKRHPLV